MAARSSEKEFIVWGVDQTAYGPVELPTLVSWVKDRRVTADTWVFVGRTGGWQKAAEVGELRSLFPQESVCGAGGGGAMTGLKGMDPSELRRIRILGGLTDEQVEHFSQFVEVEKVLGGTVIIKQGERDDALYMILEGEVRVRLVVLGKEAVLTTLGAGDFFGDLALLDHGPRSAEVVANTDSILVKMSGSAFDQMAKAWVDMASQVLQALDRTLTERIRADNARYDDVVRHARAAE